MIPDFGPTIFSGMISWFIPYYCPATLLVTFFYYIQTIRLGLGLLHTQIIKLDDIQLIGPLYGDPLLDKIFN